jgi:flagellar motor switch protein FliM
MSDMLSAEEIASLFAAAKDGSLPDGARSLAPRARSMRKIDFSRPMKLSLLEQRRFEKAHAGFCREASERLSSELRTEVELEVINTSQLTWGGALEDVPHPSLLGVVGCSRSEAILLCVEEALVLRMIDCLLGASLTTKVAPRELTEIDTALARHIFEELIVPLSSVWQELLGLNLRFLDFDLQNTSLEYLPPIQPALEMTIEVRYRGSSATIVLLVPYNAIEAAGKRLGGERQPTGGASDAQASKRVRSALSAVKVEARAELGALDLTLGEVLSLGEGDLVNLGAAGIAGIAVGETALHIVQPGLSGNHRAVKVIESAGGLS